MPQDAGSGDRQSAFRQINRHIAEAGAAMFGDDEIREFLCECGRADCETRFRLSFREYRELHAGPERSLVAPGHEDRGDRVVERHAWFWVVEAPAGEQGRG